MKKICLIILAFVFANVVFSQRPNILWLSIEDTSPQFISCYGNKNARTPVIDGLAAKGVRFTNAFATGTVCAPTRFSIITGVRTYEAGTGHHRSAYPVPDFIKGFPTYLKNVGYYTSNNVKTDYNTEAERRIIKDSWNESSVRAGWWDRKPGQPFFSVVNFTESHQSRTMTGPYANYERTVLNRLKPEERIGDNDFSMPPFYKDSPEMRKQVARIYNSLKLTDNLVGQVLERLKQDNLMDSTIVFFFGDHGEGMPRAKTNGIGLGYHVPFVVWFPPMYQHLSPWKSGIVTDELMNFEDLAPTVLSLAGIEAPTHMKGRALAGKYRAKEKPFVFLSTDRSDESTDLVRSVTDGRYIYSRNYMASVPETRWIEYQEVSDIKKQIRKDHEAGTLSGPQLIMLAEHRPAEFLFDLNNDPWELHNLAGEKNSKAILDKMRKALDAHILEARDVLFLPEDQLAAIKSPETPYTFRMKEAKYPFKKIYAVAKLSGWQDEHTAAQQLKLLTDGNSVVRYWAITGLQSQPDEFLKKNDKQLTAALSDPYTPVQIITAAILYKMNNDQQARAILTQHITHSNLHYALLALQQVGYLKDPAPFRQALEEVNRRGRAADFNVHAASQVLLARLGLKEMKLEN
jgi:arylsulfatase A-like enzyme